jgi:hypothetical protein
MLPGGAALDMLEGPCAHAAAWNAQTLDWGEVMTLDQAAMRAYAEQIAEKAQEGRPC